MSEEAQNLDGRQRLVAWEGGPVGPISMSERSSSPKGAAFLCFSLVFAGSSLRIFRCFLTGAVPSHWHLRRATGFDGGRSLLFCGILGPLIASF